jgi:ABC-2 type transport system ATP-binding protein
MHDNAPLLTLEDVTKTFGDLRAVDGLSFEVRRGEVFGFLGPNGAGKTTTLRMAMGITHPDTGRIAFDAGRGMDRQRIGYLPEERGLFEDAGVLETLVYLGTLRGMSRSDAGRAGREWLGRLGLADRLKDKLATLSKGNQQKVQFAGAVLHGPALAVLDEPFSGLDPLNQELFIDLIAGLRTQHTAVLLSGHQLDLVQRLCDRFLLIARGRPVLAGTMDEMRAKASGGAGQVVALSLRSARPRSLGEVEGILAQATSASHRVSENGGGRIEVELELPPDSDLGPILAVVSDHFRVERVVSRVLSLREVYVRAVREADPAEPRAIEDALR